MLRRRSRWERLRRSPAQWWTHYQITRRHNTTVGRWEAAVFCARLVWATICA